MPNRQIGPFGQIFHKNLTGEAHVTSTDKLDTQTYHIKVHGNVYMIVI